MTFDPVSPNLPNMVEAERMQCRFPSRPDWIEPAVDFLRQRALLCGACDETRAGKIMIGLHEAISNAIVHGNLEISSALKESGDSAFAQELANRCADARYASRRVAVEVEYDGNECRWSITDEGKGFDVARMLERDPTTGEEILLSSGRGMLLMRAFFDSVQYELGGRRVNLVLRKSPRDEQRRAERASNFRRVRLVPVQSDGTVDWEAAYEGLSHNLTNDGMAILQAHLATAERVLIGLDAGGGPMYVPATVRHFRQIGADFIELGCQFQAQFPPELPANVADIEAARKAIAELVDRLQNQRYPDDERRAHPRVAYTCPIQIDGEKDGEPTIGFGRDLSQGGIAFVTTAPLSYRPCRLTLSSLGGPPFRVVAQIVRCDRIMDGFYDVGARFNQLNDE